MRWWDRLRARLTSRRAASALQLRHARCRRGRVVLAAAIVSGVIAAEASTIAERDIVRAGDALGAPRHSAECWDRLSSVRSGAMV